MKNAFFKTLYELTGEDPRIQFVKSDMAYIPDFQNAFPEHYLDVGIAEQNMIGIAAGMAKEGMMPFTYSIVNFATMRCLEQIRDDIAYHNLNVKIISCGQGFDYGALGTTHHATEDLAIMRVIPDMVVFCPCDPVETVAVVKAAAAFQGPCFIRNGLGGEPVLHEGNLKDFQIGKSYPLLDGQDILLLVSGSIANDAVLAALQLRKQGFDVGVYSFPTVKPLDSEFICSALNSARLIVTVEEHSVIGGFGGAVAEFIAEAPEKKARFKRIGIQDMFSHEIGSKEYLKHYYKIGAQSIEEAVRNIMYEISER